jgi:hypothetical protein
MLLSSSSARCGSSFSLMRTIKSRLHAAELGWQNN